MTLYALSAAIPHALLLLHALMDVLPFPAGPGGMWYEIATDTVECIDEMDGEAEGEEEFAGLGAMEDDGPELQTRNKSSIRIDIHVAPRAKSVHSTTTKKRKNGAKARPSAKKRRAMKGVAAAADEEDMMNA